MTRLARPLAVAAFAAALAGCPQRVPPPDLSLEPAALAAQVRRAQARVATVRGEVRVKLDASGTVPALVAAERPDRLHVEVLDFFGNAVAVLAAAGGELSLYDARERVLYRGAATAENLARLVPVPLTPAELVEILCGSAPLLEGAPVRATPGRGFVELVLAAGARTQTLRVGPEAVVLRSELREGGARAPGTYDLAFGSHGPYGTVRFPAEASLSAEEPRVRMALVWTDAEPNAALDPALFAPAAPRGARVVDLADAPPPASLFPEPGAPDPPP